MGTAALSFLGILALPASAQESVKSCPGVEVRSIRDSVKAVQDLPLDGKQETIETGASRDAGNTVTIVARGPVLGSMDSEKVDGDIVCTEDGFALTATITRSANFNGAVRQNVLWSPEITAVIAPRRPAVVVQTIWKMRLSNGEELKRARTPPYPQQHYPVTVKQTVRAGQ